MVLPLFYGLDMKPRKLRVTYSEAKVRAEIHAFAHQLGPSLLHRACHFPVLTGCHVLGDQLSVMTFPKDLAALPHTYLGNND